MDERAATELGRVRDHDHPGAGDDPAQRAAAIAEARGRLDELNQITRQYGRPYSPTKPLDEVIKELPSDWYRGWK